MEKLTREKPITFISTSCKQLWRGFLVWNMNLQQVEVKAHNL
jgi:hypothetical protein